MRCTVGEIDEVVLGARWREARAMDLLAWQTAHLLNAAGSKPAKPGEGVPSEDAWSAEKLLGRPMTPDDPHGPKPLTEAEQALEDENREKRERAEAFLDEHNRKMQERGRLTDGPER